MRTNFQRDYLDIFVLIFKIHMNSISEYSTKDILNFNTFISNFFISS